MGSGRSQATWHKTMPGPPRASGRSRLADPGARSPGRAWPPNDRVQRQRLAPSTETTIYLSMLIL